MQSGHANAKIFAQNLVKANEFCLKHTAAIAQAHKAAFMHASAMAQAQDRVSAAKDRALAL